ncbi:EAL domain-containing protein [Salmonella enterica subsp. enterica serovar Javiana]|nr:EAL domain-containing protein [Salmonella enterica]EDR1539458.1 EAL domain-containing protein [Salmonella enterica subsp. enterica serovar Javiana]EIV1873447.1 EAL domain-containing protein [Salmonella enterica]EKB2995569.1 EAL domain-containing protein [Salmonella enterica]
MPVSEYNHILVAVSFAVAIFASYTALNMAGRVAGSARSNARIWLMGGGFALGVGIWAMHFVGMLAMDHAMNMRFDPFLTGLSMLIAIGSSLFALWLVSAEKLRLRRLLPGALVMGLGISAMHYTGMAALQFASIIVWNSAWVALSIIIALLASCGALWLTFRLRHEGTDVALRRAGAAVLMGIAIAGMHYAGMKAAHFPQNWPMEHRGVDSNWLAVLVSVVALTILGITLLVSLFDARLQARTALLASYTGRNGYHFFQPSMNMLAQTQLQLMNDLWLALERQELRLVYQPKFQAPAGPIVGFEALLRWYHPKQGVLNPDQFLPLAEKTGLIVTIGSWVIDEACRQLREWHLQGYALWSVAVNLSALQFEQPGLVDTITRSLARHSIRPDLLILEITETTAMNKPEQSVAILTRLTEMGVKASIDDFGTGYSSLLYLKRLPACELKIDRAFVHELSEASDGATIVAAIVALAKALNLQIVAEGVENETQQQFLTQLGCHTLQGFLLGKPRTAEEIARDIRDPANIFTRSIYNINSK